MSKIGIFYGSSTGNTKDVAEMVASKLNVGKEDVYDVASASADFKDYQVLIFGSSTWGVGDLQDDWEGFISKVSSSDDLGGKKVALFGCGDSSSYPDSFCDALGKIYEAIKGKGCTIIGTVDPKGYTYDASEAIVDGKFVGLPIDMDNESQLTDTRVDAWTQELKTAI